MKAVRIERNINRIYSAYIYSYCIYTGTYANCIKELNYRGENI